MSLISVYEGVVVCNCGDENCRAGSIELIDGTNICPDWKGRIIPSAKVGDRLTIKVSVQVHRVVRAEPTGKEDSIEETQGKKGRSRCR